MNQPKTSTDFAPTLRAEGRSRPHRVLSADLTVTGKHLKTLRRHPDRWALVGRRHPRASADRRALEVRDGSRASCMADDVV